MCVKVDNRIACERCGYPWSEARYPDDWNNPLSCQATEEEIDKHFDELDRLQKDLSQHPYDCKCLLCV